MASSTKPIDAPQARSTTQAAENQVPPLTGYNLFLTDHTLSQAIDREGAGWARTQLTELGRMLGTEEAQRLGFEANENTPVLHTHDRYGNRRDEVVFHPSWHQLMRTSVENRLHSLPWETKNKGAHVARAALMMLIGCTRRPRWPWSCATCWSSCAPWTGTGTARRHRSRTILLTSC